MSKPIRASLVRTALLASALALGAAAAQATEDFTAVLGTCSPGSASALQYDLKLTNGAVTKPGRNPPSQHLYYCGVLGLAVAAPSWDTFELQYSDQNPTGNGHVSAQLMRKRLTTGAATTVARVESVPSTNVRTVQVVLPAPLDFSLYTYFILVRLETPSSPVTAHRVTLKTTR